jgi:hypothetical protein
MQNVQALLHPPSSPCVSLYLPTHPGGAEQDLIRWKNLLQEAEEQLAAGGMCRADVRALLQPAQARPSDNAFWNSQSGSLAFFLTWGWTRWFRLPEPLAERAVVGNELHVKPLLPLPAEAGRFFLLAIGPNRVRLLQGSRYGMQEIDGKEMPRSLAEALRCHGRLEPLEFHTYPVLEMGFPYAGFHHQEVDIDDARGELLLSFERIDRAMHELLAEESVPVVVAAVEPLGSLYRQASTYTHLLEGFVANPDSLSSEDLHESAWPLVEQHAGQRRREAAALCSLLADTGRTSDELSTVVAAAHQGRVDILLTAAGADHWGTFDPMTGCVARHETPCHGDVELVNLAVARTLLHGGTVHVIDPNDAPAKVRLPAAIYRRPYRQNKAGE